MADIPTLRTAIATAVATISGLRAHDKVPDQINAREAVVYRKGIEYNLDMGSTGATYDFGITVYSGRAAERSSQDFLDNLCEAGGSTSLKAAVEGNTALDALCDWVHVISAGETQVSTVGSVDYLSVEFVARIVV